MPEYLLSQGRAVLAVVHNHIGEDFNWMQTMVVEKYDLQRQQGADEVDFWVVSWCFRRAPNVALAN